MSRYQDIQFTLSSYFSIESYQLTFYRLWMVLVGIFLPVYGYVLQWSVGNAIDYMSHRLVLTALLLSLFFGSFISPFIKKYIVLFAYLGNWVSWTWIVWVVMVNNFSTDYSLGLWVSAFCVGMAHRNWAEMVSFYIYIGMVIFYAFHSLPNPEGNGFHMAFSLIVIVVAQFLVFAKWDLVKKDLAIKHNELKEKNKELQQFVHIASHDLKTPIRTIGSFSSLIKKRVGNTGNEELIEFSQYVEDGAKQMNTLIEDLLRYSNISHSVPQFSIFNLEQMIQNELHLFDDPNGSIQEMVTLHGKAPQKMIGNKHQISQLFLNLIDNGLKYNRSSQKMVHVTMGEDASFWNFSIRDNGIGIDELYADKIFSIFGRLHGKNEFEGTGIGLAICQKIIENHNGKISIQSMVGVGTTVNFSISKKLRLTNPQSKSLFQLS